MIAEAKCLIAVRYFDMFRHYGGLPLLYASFEGNESSYECPRATVEETVNYMIKMLDEAIDSGALPGHTVPVPTEVPPILDAGPRQVLWR